MSDENSTSTFPDRQRVETSPTRAERRALVRELQRQALTLPDKLAANIRVLTADLMSFAHEQAAQVQASLENAPTPGGQRQRYQEDAELFLKYARQIDRMVALARQLSAPAPGEEPAR